MSSTTFCRKTFHRYDITNGIMLIFFLFFYSTLILVLFCYVVCFFFSFYFISHCYLPNNGNTWINTSLLITILEVCLVFFFLISSIKENESTLLLSVFLFLKFLLTENRISRKNFHLKLLLCCFFLLFHLNACLFSFFVFFSSHSWIFQKRRSKKDTS